MYKEDEEDFSFTSFFVPLTTLKAITIIVILGFIVFGNALFNSFVWDDKAFIIFNPEVHSLNIFSLMGQNAFNSLGHYRPIPAVYFASMYAVFKDIPFFYHFVQIGLHIVNASLLFILLKKFFDKKLSLFLSLIFLVHPMQVESVSYIASSVNTLFLLFGMVALLLLDKEKISLKRFFIIFGILLLSLLTKETGFLFLLMALLYVFLFKRNILTSFILGGITITIIYLLIRLGLAGVAFAKQSFVPIASLPFDERLLQIPAVLFYYLKTFFFPTDLIVQQHWIISNVTLSQFYFPLLVLSTLFVLLITFGIHLSKTKIKYLNVFLFFSAWSLIGLMFHSQIFPLDMTVADRWFYFPIVGLLGLLAVVLTIIKFPLAKMKMFVYCVALIILVFFSLRTMTRNVIWANEISLYTHDMRIHNNYQLENDLGAAYMDEKNYEQALIHAKKSTEMYSFDTNLFNTGLVYEALGNMQEAERYYIRAYTSNIFTQGKRNVNIYIRLAKLYVSKSQYKEARDVLKKGLQDYPGVRDMWLLSAITEYQLHNQQEALLAAERAKTLSPDEQTNYLYIKILNNEPIVLE